MNFSQCDLIKSPQELKNLDDRALEVQAKLIRELMIEVVSKNGGHLAPSLGTVELTLALHAVFDTPKDKILWDVGHQAYGHKIVTERAEVFSTLRCTDGISGFPRRCESEFDVFGVGHSSTSISAALGIALARDLAKKDYSVIAVIGDAAISSGMAFEAMNHAGVLGTKLLVILNDNGMSIGANVGALSRYLNRIRMGQRYQRVKGDVENLLRKVPGFGGSLLNAYEKAKGSVKQIVLPGRLFEDLGFTYYGPIDGHDIHELRKSFEKARMLEGPVLLHVFTQKGKGYDHAESQPAKFHGVGPFSVDSGEKTGGDGDLSYSQVFGQAMLRAAQADSKVVAISAAMVEGTGLGEFFAAFPDRSFDVGIAEQHAVTMAAGMSTMGYRPVVAIYSTFLQRAYDQILHDICLQEIPVVFALDRAGIVGEDGPTHHGLFDLSYLSHMPNMEILAPGSLDEVDPMLKYALKADCPVALRYPRGSGRSAFPGSTAPVQRGKGVCLHKGHKIAVFALGTMVEEAACARESLILEGIDFTLINARFAKPLDFAMLDMAAAEHQIIITLEENLRQGGMGQMVADYLNKKAADVKVIVLGVDDAFVRHGNRNYLLHEVGLDRAAIADSIRECWRGDPKVPYLCSEEKNEQRGFLTRLFAKDFFNGR